MKTYKTESGMTFKESELVTNKNPFALEDGSWDINRTREWLAWNEAKEAFKLDQMNDLEREKYLKSKRHIQDRMRIESEGD